jgi:hypothetical protein
MLPAGHVAEYRLCAMGTAMLLRNMNKRENAAMLSPRQKRPRDLRSIR